jgi:hypothetical protein
MSKCEGQHYEGAGLMREAAEQKAKTIFIRELRTKGLTEEELDEGPRSDPLKWKIATVMRTETTVPLKWIAGGAILGPIETSATRWIAPDSSPDTYSFRARRILPATAARWRQQRPVTERRKLTTTASAAIATWGGLSSKRQTSFAVMMNGPSAGMLESWPRATMSSPPKRWLANWPKLPGTS